MQAEMEITTVKCGYCGNLFDRSVILEHYCFSIFNANIYHLVVHNGLTAVMEKKNNGTGANQEVVTSEESRSEEVNVDELLIVLIRNRPALWDHTIPTNESTPMKKKALWQEVGNYMSVLRDYTAVQVFQRWSTLKYQYVNARTKYMDELDEINRNGTSSNGRGQLSEPTFQHYRAMSFLNKVLTHRPTKTYLRFDESQDASTSANTGSSNIDRPPPTPSPTGSSNMGIPPSPNEQQAQQRRNQMRCSNEEDIENLITETMEQHDMGLVNADHAWAAAMVGKMQVFSGREKFELQVHMTNIVNEAVRRHWEQQDQ